jgi:rRNA-processing protein FCF1
LLCEIKRLIALGMAMQVILDGNFIHWALKHKIDIEARITAVLQQGACQFLVTR